MGWESQYPDFSDLTSPQAKAELEAVWKGADTANPLWHAAVMNEFLRATLAKEDIHPWILEFLHKQMQWVLAGSAWDDVFKLPGRNVPKDWNALSPKDERDANLFIEVAKAVEAGQKTTDALNAVAARNHTSFETVRSAYYAWDKVVSWRRDVSKKVAE